MFFQRCLAVVAVVLLAACSMLPTRPAGGMVADLPEDTAPILQEGLSPEFSTAAQRLEVQQQTWQLVADRYYDPALNGVDWVAVREKYRPQVASASSDAEFYLALKSMVRELKDSHLRVVTPRESVDHRRYAARSTGIALTVIDDRLVVLDVDPESPAARGAPGDIVPRSTITASIRLPAGRARPAAHRRRHQFARGAADAGGRGDAIRAAAGGAACAAGAPDAPPPAELLLQRDTGRSRVSVMAEPLVRPPRSPTRRLESGVAVISSTGSRSATGATSKTPCSRCRQRVH
jgi:hypothetical protein